MGLMSRTLGLSLSTLPMPVRALLLVAVLLVLAVAPRAQEMPGWEAEPAYGRMVLHAGYDYDPRVMDVDAAGVLDNPLGVAECSGYYGDRPDHVVEYVHYDWAPEMGGVLTFSASGGLDGNDLTLVVRTPSGAYHCNDDTGGLNPRIDVSNEPGTYRIWVGNVALAEYEAMGIVGVSETGTVVE